MKELKLVKVLSRLEDASSLDPASERLTGLVNRLVRPQGLRDLLHGVPAESLQLNQPSWAVQLAQLPHRAQLGVA